jgi:hypothetical protein
MERIDAANAAEAGPNEATVYVMSDVKRDGARSKLVRAELRRLYADSRELREDSCRLKAG